MSFRVVAGKGPHYQDKEALVEEMEKIFRRTPEDPEAQHLDADNLLCELLGALGYGEVVRAYKKIPRWYS